MNTGLIVLHCWEDMQNPIELEAMSKIKTVLADTRLPVLGSVITRQDIRDLIPNCVHEDIMIASNRHIIEQWVKKHKINNIVLAGFHYNLCIRQLESRLFELCESMGKDWNNDFKVQVLQDCTAAVIDDEVFNMAQYRKVGETHNLITLTQWTNIS